MSPHTLQVSSAANATVAPANGTLSRCASDLLTNATAHLPHTCSDTSGYSFELLVTRPTNEQIMKMCTISACHITITAIQRALPNECQLPNAVPIMLLYQDVLNPVTRSCTWKSSNHTSGSSASASGDHNNTIVAPPIQATTGSAASGLGVGPLLGLVAAVILCGVVAMFVMNHRKRQRLEAVLATENSRSHPLSVDFVMPLGEEDDFSSKHATSEFTALAVSSNVSSNPSRASTAQSMGSDPDGDLVMMNSPFLSIDAAFEDPALVMIRIPINKIQIGELKSQGGFGQIYTGTYDHQLPVAVKKLLPGKCHEPKDLVLFLDEAKVLAKLSHERIERLVGVAWDPMTKDPLLLTEYIPGVDLREFLDRYAVEQQLVGFSIEKVQIALHVAEGLYYLHTRDTPVIHRDLKSRNVLLTPKLDAIVADIGIRRERETRDYFSGSLWSAPEIIMGEPWNEKADIFAFGVLLSEIDTHSLPYAQARDSEGQWLDMSKIHQQVINGTLRVSFSERADPDLVALGKQCVSVNPRHRPSARDLYKRVNHVMKSYVAFAL